MVMSSGMPKTRSRTGCFTCRKRKKKCDELLYPVCQNCQEKNLTCQWPLKKHEFHQNMEQVKYIGHEDKTSKTEETSSLGIKRHSPKQHDIYIENEREPKKRNEGQKKRKEDSFMPIRPFSEASDSLSLKGIGNDISAARSAVHGNQFPYEVPAHSSDSTTETHDNGASDLEIHGRQVLIRHPPDLIPVKLFGSSKLDSIRLQKKRHNYFLERIAMQQDCVDSEEEITDVAPASPFEIDSLIDNDYILNDKDKRGLVERAQSPIPKAQTRLSDLHQPETAFPYQLTVSGSNHETNVHSSLVPLKTPNSTHKDRLQN